MQASWHSDQHDGRLPPREAATTLRASTSQPRGSPMTLKRRQFLSAGATALAAGAIAKPAVAQSAPEIKWRLTSSFPRQLDTIFGTAQTLAKYVAEATD